MITTFIGARGLGKGQDKAFLVVDTADELVEQISNIFDDKKFKERLSKNAHKFIKEYNKENINNLKEVFNNNQ